MIMKYKEKYMKWHMALERPEKSVGTALHFAGLLLGCNTCGFVSDG
jgi:hypothetical protein